MARLRSINEQELMKATEELLLEKGYDGLHFKLLAERLGVGRSTIYEYYANKDELVAAYMVNLLETITNKCMSLDDRDPVQQLKEMLKVFISYSFLHQFLQYMPHLKAAKTGKTQAYLEKLEHDHHKLFALVANMVKHGQEQDLLRKDLTPEMMSSIFFNIIQVPRFFPIDVDDWSERLFSVIFYGVQSPKK